MKYKFLFLLSILIIAGCEESSGPDDCPENIGCTEQFVMFTFSPTDSEDKPVYFDAYYSQNMDNSKVYDSFDEQDFLDAGTYMVLTDQEMEDLKKTGTVIRFFGQLDGDVIFEQDFLIGHDCCHILPLEGPGVGN
jgi:hypothetical protein